MHNEELTRAGFEVQAPTLRELAIVLFRRQRVFLVVAILIVTVAVIYLFAGSRYQAHLEILVRRGRADTPVTAQENAPVDMTRMAITEEELNSEVELLKDDAVLRQVVQENGLDRRHWIDFLRFGEGEAERQERASRRLAKKLNIQAVKKTNLISIDYNSENPAQAARVLDSLSKAYFAKHTEVHRPAGELPFFEQQTAESRRQLEEAQQKLLQFTSTHDVVAAAQQRDLALQQLSEAEASYRHTQIEIAEAQRRAHELANLLMDLPERTTTQVRSADNPELLKALKSSLLDLELKRTQLLTKFEPSHRLVQEVDQQIAQAKAAIAAEGATPVRDETTDKNPNYEWAKAELQRTHVELKGLEARFAATSVELAGYRAMTRQFGDDAIVQDDLVNTEKAAEDNYLLYVKKREEARMDDALDQRGIVNVAIAGHPSAPLLPLWSTWAVLIVGFVVAGAGGAASAFAAEHFDPRFRGPDDVLAYLEAPVLASLPRGLGSLPA